MGRASGVADPFLEALVDGCLALLFVESGADALAPVGEVFLGQLDEVVGAVGRLSGHAGQRFDEPGWLATELGSCGVDEPRHQGVIIVGGELVEGGGQGVGCRRGSAGAGVDAG